MSELVDKIFLRFPETKALILDIALRNLANCRVQCEELAGNYLEAELGYLYTADPAYLAAHGSALPAAATPGSMADAFVGEMRTRVQDYFVLVFRGLRDNVPKCIGNTLLNESCQRMNVELIESINKSAAQVVATLSEPESIVLMRKQCSETLGVLKRCLKKLQDEDIVDVRIAM